jgi:ABC-type oligopeptide transport system substrate-binding subunit
MIATDLSWQASTVIMVSLAASMVCLIIAIILAFAGHDAKKAIRGAAAAAGSKARARVDDPDANPAQPQAAVDYDGLSKLAEALAKLSPSGQFLIAALAFAASAALAAGVSEVASAVAS